MHEGAQARRVERGALAEVDHVEGVARAAASILDREEEPAAPRSMRLALRVSDWSYLKAPNPCPALPIEYVRKSAYLSDSDVDLGCLEACSLNSTAQACL